MQRRSTNATPSSSPSENTSSCDNNNNCNEILVGDSTTTTTTASLDSQQKKKRRIKKQIQYSNNNSIIILIKILFILIVCSIIGFFGFIIVYSSSSSNTNTTIIQEEQQPKILLFDSKPNNNNNNIRINNNNNNQQKRSLEVKQEKQRFRSTFQEDNDERNNNNDNIDNKIIVVSELDNDIDYEKFTIRINTWKREEQLQLSIQHHLSCNCVAQIQIIWCTEQGPVPIWLENQVQQYEQDAKDNGMSYTRLIVEEHEKNSLNERFNVLQKPPTKGILSIDDDVIRPCLALESTFIKWLYNINRQVGFDARTIVKNPDNSNILQYGYMSTTEKLNKYYITLTRYSFQHVDYLYTYMNKMPYEIKKYVDIHFNCEDIAMSLWISSNTDSKPPLLADYWAVKSQIKIYVENKISSGNDHKDLRDICIQQFTKLLHIDDTIQPVQLHRNQLFDYGDISSSSSTNDNNDNNINEDSIIYYHKHVLDTIQRWKNYGGIKDNKILLKELANIRTDAAKYIYKHGLLEKSDPWKKRFSKKIIQQQRKRRKK